MTRRRLVAGIAVAAALGFVFVYVVAIHTSRGLAADRSAFERASGNAPLPFKVAGARVLRTIDVATVAVVLLALAFLAVARRRFARAAAAAAVVVASIGSAELLKVTLPMSAGRPPTFPSGHTAIAVSLGTALVLAVPPVARPTAALAGAAYAAAIAYAVVVLGWHFPSDAIASFFLCGFWAALAGLTLPGAPRLRVFSWPALGIAVGAVAAALVMAAAVAARHAGAVEAVRSRPVLAAAAAAFGLLSLITFVVLTPLLEEPA